jgi:hypothetical protein
MSENNVGDRPAFPCDKPGLTEQRGMSLRDYFAAKAMQGILAAEYSEAWRFDKIAEMACDAADAMLAVRKAK